MASLESPENSAAVTRAVEAVFGEYEERFSLYRAESELSAIASGSLLLGEASEWLLDTYSEALYWRERTDGAFTPHRPDGVIDLNGIVKAHAIRDAGRIIAAAASDWILNVGGDVLVGGTNGGTPWSVGIVDPADRSALLAAVELISPRTAVATSGIAERGDHVWRGGSRAAPDFAQVTVIADDIVTADVLATAIVAGGRTSLDDCTDRWSIDVLAVSRAGELLMTPGFRSALAVSPGLG
jgi:thiamine biosynthesis lipoprotein